MIPREPPSRQQGAVLLVMLSLVLFAITAMTLGRLSVNRLSTERQQDNARALNLAREALLGYALRQPVTGTLPCPDINPVADGVSDVTAGNCSRQIGRLPYRTLGLDAATDASGTLLWYAVAPAYTLTPTTSRNSSISAHYRLDGNPVAAVIIAPGRALDNQQRAGVAVADYLEGENANVSVDTYSRFNDDDHNDQLLGVGAGHFWYQMERKVLGEVAALLKQYRAACTNWPWAAPWNSSMLDSQVALQTGKLPLNTSAPVLWNTGCAAGTTPSANLRTHWGNLLYYQFCTDPEGLCLNLVGDHPGNAAAVVLSPGTALATQTRPSITLSDYYEGDNLSPDNRFRTLKANHHTGSFNDSVARLAP